LDHLVLPVRLFVEIEKQGEENGRVQQQKGGHQFRISTVEEQYLRRMEENQRELELRKARVKNRFNNVDITRLLFIYLIVTVMNCY